MSKKDYFGALSALTLLNCMAKPRISSACAEGSKDLVSIGRTNIHKEKRHHMSHAISSKRGCLLRAVLMSPVLVLSALFTFEAQAVSLPLNGNRTVLSGTDCGIATYRFDTTATYGGQALDLLIEVLAEDNEYSGRCVGIESNVLAVRMKDADPDDDVAYMDLKVTVVRKNTTTPVEVDRILLTSFDLDIDAGLTSTDDVYLRSPDSSYLSSTSLVTYSKGSFFGGSFQAKLKGTTTKNCNDTAAVVDPTCRGGAVFINGANGVNTVSSTILRLQNDNAYGQSGSLTDNRLFQISFEIGALNAIVDNNNDYGDAPATYGSAGNSINANIALGYGLVPDNDATAKASANANGDDTDTQPIEFDDEDGVRLNGAALNGQSIEAGSIASLNVNTFGTGYLSAWVDLDRNGNFSGAGERVVTDLLVTSTTVTSSTVPITIPGGATLGNSFIRFRFTQNAGGAATGLSTAEGEVEDYLIVLTASDPNVRLVKRITAINGLTTNPNDGTNLTAVVNDGVANSSDDAANWPNNYLVGALNAGAVKPGDDIEYTIYFFNAGGQAAPDVKICDRLFPGQTLVANAYGPGSDVQLRLGTSAPLGLTAANDSSDRTQLIAANATVPTTCNLKDPNNNGTLQIDVTGVNGTGNPALTQLPRSTGQGTPNNAYGFFRFKARINPTPVP